MKNIKILWITILLFPVSLTDYYSTLNVKRDATTKEIRSAFKKLALSSHPDKNKDDPDAEAKFMEINEAYEILKDEGLRRKYDLYGEEGLKEDKDRQQQRERHSYQYYREDFDIYGDDVEIITLSSGDFAASVENRGENVWFINYYSPRCSHCHDLAPIWRKLAKELEGVVRIGAVNCQDSHNLCHSIRGYPSLVLYTPNGGRSVYNGERDGDSLLKHVMTSLPPAPVIVIFETNFKRAVAELNHPWLVSFCYQSDDCVSRTVLDRVSLALKNMVYVGSVECDSNSMLCDKLPHGTGSSGLLFFQGLEPSLSVEMILNKGVAINSLNTQEIVFSVLKNLPEPDYVSDSQFKQLYNEATEGKINPQVVIFSKSGVPLEFIKLMGQLNDQKLHQIDCSTQSQICDSMFATRFPTLFVIKVGGYERYHGRQDAADMAGFIRESIASPLIELTASNFASMKESTSVVDFYAPWCPPCMRLLPELRAAAKELPHFKFGSVDCTAHSQLCTQLSIKSYPTMVMFNSSKPHYTTGYKDKAEILGYIADVLNPPVIDLDYSTWVLKINNKRADEVWFVDYYAPWCGPCRQMLPTWNQFAKSVSHWENTFVAKVDCTVNEKACDSERIESFPTLRVYTKGSRGRSQFHQYNGWGQLGDITGWAMPNLPSKVESLSPSNFVSKVLRARSPWLVEFFSPACGPCQRFAPEMERLADLLKDKVSVGKVNCNVHYNLCYQAKLRGYPTLYYYSGAPSSQQEIVGQHLETTSADDIYRFLTRHHPYLSLARTRDEL